MTTWAAPITAITLFVGDLAAARAFYTRVFDLPVHFEDDVSCVFDFENTLVNLLLATEAGELIEPAIPGADGAGPRMQLTITVDDVDAACARVTEAGATLLNGPQDRPWGVRTACFADPAGHIWEIAK